MKRFATFILFFIFLLGCSNAIQKSNSSLTIEPEDKYLWLEDVTGERALNFVKERNKETIEQLAGTMEFKELEDNILKILDSKERIPYIWKAGNYFYNFWKDDKNPRGILRRTTLEEYKKKEPLWDVILDVDELGKKEGVSWVFKGFEMLKPSYKRALVSLSKGGADASVVREFDVEKREFIKGGFELPESKGSISWIDENSVYVATDFGKDSLTDSGYPRIVKMWKRGTPLESAEMVYEGKSNDMSVGAYYDNTKGFERHFVYRQISFYESEIFLRSTDNRLVKIDVPIDANASVHREWMLISLRTPWKINGHTHPSGSLLATKFDQFLNGKRDFVVLFEPTETTSLESYNWTLNHLTLTILDNVKSKVFILTPEEGKEWKRENLQQGTGFSTISMWSVDEEESDDFFLSITDFLTPPSLYYGTIGKKLEKLKEGPHFFDSSQFEISQHFATSKDGTKIPYFQVSKKGLKLDGTNKTLLTGYGGFEFSLTPYYSGVTGYAWLSKGGVFVVANIRGGGEYGPKWHQSAIKENRNKCYEDFSAVAKDLIDRKVTSPKHLGIEGGSNGGLLMGNMLTKYPELFGAIVCESPLLDMRRYSKLLAGASWMAEYGDPDNPQEWKFIQTFSPYHNLQKGKKYPPILIMSSTKDDRVHPGHARKMTAKMMEMGLDVRYYENIEGGHQGAADHIQQAYMSALAYTFLWQTLNS